MLHLAHEAQIGVAHQDARQQPALAEDLKAVADAEHQAATRGVGAHGVHDRRAAGDGAAAQIIAITKAAGQRDEVDAIGQLVVVVPEHRGFLAGGLLQRPGHVALAIGAGKYDDGGFHRQSSMA